jgi:hypothetical protein
MIRESRPSTNPASDLPESTVHVDRNTGGIRSILRQEMEPPLVT